MIKYHLYADCGLSSYLIPRLKANSEKEPSDAYIQTLQNKTKSRLRRPNKCLHKIIMILTKTNKALAGYKVTIIKLE